MKLVKQDLISLTPPAAPCWVILGTYQPVHERYHDTIGKAYRIEEMYPVLSLAVVDDTYEEEDDEEIPGNQIVVRTIYPVSDNGMWDGGDDPRGIPIGVNRQDWSVYSDREQAEREIEQTRRLAEQMHRDMKQFDAEHAEGEKK